MSTSLYRLHPRIILEPCFQCGGRAYLEVIRHRRLIRETCTQCAGKGTLVTDDAGMVDVGEAA